MKTVFTLLFIGLVAFQSHSQSDTTKIKIGEKEIEFILNDTEEIDSLEKEIEKEVEVAMEEMEKELENLESKDDKKTKTVDYKNYSYLAGIEIYTNMLFNSDFELSGRNDEITFEADPARSINVGFSIFDKYIPIAKQHLGLVSGFTFRYTSYNFIENIELDAGQSGDIQATEQETRTYSKNRLRAGFIRIPLLLQFSTGKGKKESFHMAVGAYGGVRIGKAKYKVDYSLENQNYNASAKGHYHMNSVDYGLESRIGHGNISLIASYSLAGAFKSDAGVDLNGANLGLAFTF